MKLLRCFLAILLVEVQVWAACVHTSANVWDATLDRASVLSCASQAQNGDTINVAAGSVTWSSPIQITGGNVAIIGAGIGQSIITNGNFFDLVGTSPGMRLSGFTLQGDPRINISSGSQGYRIDHIRLEWSDGNANTCILSFGGSNPNQGLLDHLYLYYCEADFRGTDSGSPQNANKRWNEPLALGTDQSEYLEDSTIDYPNGATNAYFNGVDSAFGGRYVLRFNTIKGTRVEAHGLQADTTRGTRAYEIYNNSMQTGSIAPGFRPWFQRGGIGVLFHNTTDGTYLHEQIWIDNPRSYEGSIAGQVPTFCFCGFACDGTPSVNGSSFPDGNTSGQHGYRCRDQIGTGASDPTLWDYGVGTVPAQSSAPSYYFKNTNPSGEIPITINCGTESPINDCTALENFHLIENRDWYKYNASFTGAAGVGEGPLADRPATCTTGVGYWATNQGSWNQLGADGVLYKCTATNTWTLYYTPYTYPHPLQNAVVGSGGTAGGKVALGGKAAKN